MHYIFGTNVLVSCFCCFDSPLAQYVREVCVHDPFSTTRSHNTCAFCHTMCVSAAAAVAAAAVDVVVVVVRVVVVVVECC